MRTAKQLAKECIQEMLRTGNPVEFERVLERYFQMLLDHVVQKHQEEQLKKQAAYMNDMMKFQQMYTSFGGGGLSPDTETPPASFTWTKKP